MSLPIHVLWADVPDGGQDFVNLRISPEKLQHIQLISEWLLWNEAGCIHPKRVHLLAPCLLSLTSKQIAFASSPALKRTNHKLKNEQKKLLVTIGYKLPSASQFWQRVTVLVQNRGGHRKTNATSKGSAWSLHRNMPASNKNKQFFFLFRLILVQAIR